jgi:hypothetical protein
LTASQEDKIIRCWPAHEQGPERWTSCLPQKGRAPEGRLFTAYI